jgi:hypothetical protein
MGGGLILSSTLAIRAFGVALAGTIDDIYEPSWHQALMVVGQFMAITLCNIAFLRIFLEIAEQKKMDVANELTLTNERADVMHLTSLNLKKLLEEREKMSYYRELNDEGKVEIDNDELLQNFDNKRFKKNKTQNTKNNSNPNANAYANDRFDVEIEEVIQIEQANEQSFMPIEKENNDSNNLSISIDSSIEHKEEEELDLSSQNLLDDFLDLSLFDTISGEEESEKENKSPHLFKGSRLKVSEFSILFMATVDKLGIPEEKRDMVLDLIRFTLPTLNELPVSYYMIERTIPKPEISSFLLCKICNQEVSSSRYYDTKEEKQKFKKSKTIKKCMNDECSSNRLGLKSRSFVKVFSLNIFSQLKIIIENNENCILSNIGKILFLFNFIQFFHF